MNRPFNNVVCQYLMTIIVGGTSTIIESSITFIIVAGEGRSIFSLVTAYGSSLDTVEVGVLNSLHK